jgi:hypothetical protein
VIVSLKRSISTLALASGVLLLAACGRQTASIPRIVQQPESVLARVGQSASFRVSARGKEPFTYTWFFERLMIDGENGPSLGFDSVSAANAGLYWVTISNRWGRIASDGVLLRVATAREWSVENGGNGHRYEFVEIGERENDWRLMFDHVQEGGGYLVSVHSTAEQEFLTSFVPSNKTRLIGLIQPSGSAEPEGGWRWMSGEPLTFSNWQNGEPNNGGGINLRGFENLVGLSRDGEWNDIHGGLKAYIVEYPSVPVIYRNLTNTVVSGYEIAALRAGVAGKGPLKFEWFANGRSLAGVTGNTLPVALALKYPGPYSFNVTDGNKKLSSGRADVAFGPLFVTSPKSAVVNAGGSATFKVTVAGQGPFTYQWHRNDLALAGATQSGLTLENIATDQPGSYSVEVSNAHATARSAPAELLVLGPTDQLVLFDDFESSSHPGWSLPVTTVPPIGGRRFLGEFKRETIALTLTNLPAHDEIEISFDLMIRGYWQGNRAPDTWSVRLDDDFLLNTTFSTFTSQAYPGEYPGNSNRQAAGSLEENTLGYELSFADRGMLEDVRYRITRSGAHTNAVAVVTFSSSLHNISEAGWSLDNVAVVAKASRKAATGHPALPGNP